ncbi:hypothetical protein EHYA_08795 [Embleya hyalina]|uniref:Uncharacterized protein n=1 Tax=Embleya hyalina TaxID=516124 RepID=A0A401Z2M0_9ACTN|nr:hypothetical protein EHYA_08795 [Embleya hyalina]
MTARVEIAGTGPDAGVPVTGTIIADGPGTGRSTPSSGTGPARARGLESGTVPHAVRVRFRDGTMRVVAQLPFARHVHEVSAVRGRTTSIAAPARIAGSPASISLGLRQRLAGTGTGTGDCLDGQSGTRWGEPLERLPPRRSVLRVRRRGSSSARLSRCPRGNAAETLFNTSPGRPKAFVHGVRQSGSSPVHPPGRSRVPGGCTCGRGGRGSTAGSVSACGAVRRAGYQQIGFHLQSRRAPTRFAPVKSELVKLARVRVESDRSALTNVE